MIRRLVAPLAFAASVAVLIAACSGGATASPLSEPKDILAAAAKATQGAKSFHLDATVDGSITADLTGSGSGAPINLSGTTATADVDIANSAAHATFTAPSLFGLSGEAIAVGGKAYLKTTLTGDQYQVTDTGSLTSQLPMGSADPNASPMASDMVSGLTDALSQPGVDPVKGPDVACGSKQCYTVTINLTPEEIAALGADAGATSLPIDTSDATIDIAFQVEKDTNYLAGVNLGVTSAKQGNLKIALTFSKWNEPVTVTAPPADQVKPAG